MTKSETKLLKNIGIKAIHHDWHQTFGGKSKGNNHLNRVQKIAKHLLQKEGGNPFTTLVAAWIHDVSLSHGNDDDPQKIKQYTKEFLEEFDLNPKQLEVIISAASSHETGSTLSLEAQIVHDADVLDKSGPLGLIRHIWKTTNLIKKRLLHTSSDLQEIKDHLLHRQSLLHTSTARYLAKDLNSHLTIILQNPQAQDIMTKISKDAKQGLISDVIAKKLCLEYPLLTVIITSQINCEYLPKAR